VEGFDDRKGVFRVAHRYANERSGVRVDVELEVDGKTLTIDNDRKRHPIPDPLGSWEVGNECTSRGDLIGPPSFASSRGSRAVRIEDVSDERGAEGDMQIATHVSAEVDEGPLPTAPRIEDGLNMFELRDRRRRGGRLLDLFVGSSRRVTQPVFHRAKGQVESGSKDLEVEARVCPALLEDEVPKPVVVPLSYAVQVHTARMAHHVLERGMSQLRGLGVRGGGLFWRLFLRPSLRAYEGR